MNKYFKTYFRIWLILIVMFNVCAFALPGYAMGYNKFTPSFWMVYGFVMSSLLVQLACAYIANASTDKEKQFLNSSMIMISYAGLISVLGVGIVCIMIPKIPAWVCVVACTIVFGCNVIKLIGAKTGSDLVSGIDAQIKTDTFFIKSLTVDAETLLARANTETATTACKKVYEAVRYSDPVSHAALSAAESQITVKFEEFRQSVLSGADTSEQLCKELLIMINDRNKKCRLFK